LKLFHKSSIYVSPSISAKLEIQVLVKEQELVLALLSEEVEEFLVLVPLLVVEEMVINLMHFLLFQLVRFLFISLALSLKMVQFLVFNLTINLIFITSLIFLLCSL